MTTLTTTRTFHWADYLTFSLSFGVSITIGVVYAVKARWASQDAESYLLGDRKMSGFLNAISFLAAALTSNFVVGIPAEFYYYGIEYIWFCLAVCISAIYTSLVTIPKFRNMGFTITSAYEYIEKRFNLKLRMLVALMYVVTMIFYLSVIMYGPSVTFAHVTGQHILLAISVASVACLIYTGFGGIRAIVVVDNIQMYVLLAGMITLAAMGTKKAGGASHVYQTFDNGSRNNWNDIRVDPWQRHTVWNVIFLAGFYQAVAQGAHQMFILRYLNVPSVKSAQLTQLMLPPVVTAAMIPVLFTAMTAYALFGQCEPLMTGQIKKPDQLLSLTIMEVLGDAHGFPGIIVAAVFAAGLSTLSAGLNGLSAVFMEDFVRPCYQIAYKENLPMAMAGKIVRFSSLAMAVLVWGISLTVPYMGQTLITLAYSIEGIIVAPIFGVFFVGFFLPFVEVWGAFIGYVCGLVFTVIIFAGSLIYGSQIGFEPRPLTTAGCPIDNTTIMAATTYYPVATTEATPIEPTIWDTSYLWYPLISSVTVICMSIVISPIVHCVRHKGKPNWKKISASIDRTLLYTKDDFYLGIGRTKTLIITKEGEEENAMDSRKASVVTEKEISVNGFSHDNPAYAEDKC